MALSPNQKIEVQVKTLSGIEVYRTRVEDVSDDQLLIAAPIKQTNVVLIRPRTPVTLVYKDDSLVGQGRFRATAVVVKRVKGTVPQLLLRLTSAWQRTQERNFVRIQVLLDATYAIYENDQLQAASPCTVRDLSGGGCLILAEEQLEEKTKVRVMMNLDKDFVEVDGLIVRAMSMDHSFAYGISFLDIKEKERQTIIQYVFRRQVELRRKGLVKD